MGFKPALDPKTGKPTAAVNKWLGREAKPDVYLMKQLLMHPSKKIGVAKTRKEPLKNVPDKKIIKRGKDYRSRITSRVQTSGIVKRPQASRANLGSRVAALLKPKTEKKDEDKLG